MIECSSYITTDGCGSDNFVHIHKTDIYSHVVNYGATDSKLVLDAT